MDLIATGMVSALGYDPASACAAARAGLARSSELPFVVLENDRSPGLAVGHAAHLLTDGFDGDARLVRLLGGALSDLVLRLPDATLAASRVAYYLSIPAADRTRQGMNLILTDERRQRYLEHLTPPEPVDEVARGMMLLDGAMRMAKLPAGVRAGARAIRVSTVGHAAVGALCQRAQKDLDSGAIDLAMVGAADSLVDAAALSWLHATGRLKCADVPAGVCPGEAAAVLLFAGPQSRLPHDLRPRASVERVATRVSGSQLLSGTPADGYSQFEIVRDLSDAIGSRETQWLLSDQNGEVFRATDWGSSLVRLQAVGVRMAEGAVVWHPAGSFGDVGAACGAVATCMASEAFVRGYARSRHAFVLTNSDGPARAGHIVSAAGN